MAREWTNHLSPTGQISHRPDIVNAYDRYCPGTNWRFVGENVGQATFSHHLNSGWWNSPSHRAHILGDFDQVGIGAVYNPTNNRWVATVNFIDYP